MWLYNHSLTIHIHSYKNRNNKDWLHNIIEFGHELKIVSDVKFQINDFQNWLRMNNNNYNV